MKTSEHHFRRLWQKLCSNYRSKISVAVTLLLILFMGIGFAEMYFFTRSIVLERTHAYMQNSATSCSINIVNSIEEIEDVTLSILGNASIQDDLLTLEQEGLDEYTSYHCGMELRETLGSYALLRTEISSVCLVTKQGATYSYSKSHQQAYSRIGDMADTIYAHSGKVVWYVDDDDYQTLSCARSISYLPDLKTRGLVSVSVSESYIRSLYEELVPRDMGEVYLLDENNVVISSLTGDALGQSLTETFSTLLAHPGEDYHVMRNGNSIYISDPMPNQWRLVMLVPRAYYLDGMGRIGVIFLISAFVLACLGGMAIWGITHPLTKPIYELAHAMEDFGHGNLKAQSPVRTHDEIGMLSDTFNRMVTDMHRLYITAYEKELMRQSTELRALRMQINPHFLYNTLDTINWTARFSGADQVGDMACSLGNLLRYSLSPGDFTVLAKEVASLGDYLEIQQVRYGDKMQVEVDVDASFGNIDVPKLIIQPIVENAIVHGIEKKIEDGKIHIWAELDGDTDLLLHIDDDGVGMDAETARGLLLKQKSGDFRRSSHIGVYNVHRRIQMYYGDGYGATIHSEVGVGTSVTLRIKALREPEDPPEGQGLIEQTLFDSYMEENPNVTIEVEALDDESYKTKFKAYATGGNMPDLVNIWCSPSFLDEVVAAGTLEPLNADDYADYGFTEGSLDGVTYDGQIYGLPRNTDVLGFYYNKDLFEANGVEVPTTWDELLAAAQVFQDAGISPIAMDGQDKWPLAHFINCMIGTVKGADTYATMVNSVQNSDYSDPAWKDTVTAASEQASLLFQPGFETTDYATAMNLFMNGQSAMFFMGSWEMSMAPDFEVGYFTMPDFDGDGQGVIGAYNGGGYAISSSSAVKEEATALLNYMFQPENWSKLSWENGVCMSAQDFSQYLTGNETDLQNDIINALNTASGITGMTYNDLGDSAYKTLSEDSTAEVLSGMISVDDFFTNLQNG